MVEENIPPTPEPDLEYDETQPENPNITVSIELLPNGDVAVTLNKDAASLGDILTAFELGKLNVVRQYYEHLDKESSGEV